MLYQIAGLSSAPPAELDDDQRAQLSLLLIAKAEQAITAGVRISLEIGRAHV